MKTEKNKQMMDIIKTIFETLRDIHPNVSFLKNSFSEYKIIPGDFRIDCVDMGGKFSAVSFCLDDDMKLFLMTREHDPGAYNEPPDIIEHMHEDTTSKSFSEFIVKAILKLTELQTKNELSDYASMKQPPIQKNC